MSIENIKQMIHADNELNYQKILNKNTIDLNKCEKGDILISSHGLELEYVCKTPWKHYKYLDHVVKYPSDEFGDENYGTRTNDGFVFAKSRKPETDHDIVKIIKKHGTFRI